MYEFGLQFWNDLQDFHKELQNETLVHCLEAFVNREYIVSAGGLMEQQGNMR